jgi:nicotinamidase-related amidase
MAEFRPALIVVDFQEDFCPPVRTSNTRCIEIANIPGRTDPSQSKMDAT